MLKQPLRCPICRKKVRNPEQLRIHRIRKHRGTVYGDDWVKSTSVVVTE